MKRLRFGAAILALGLSSYAQGARSEGGLGGPVPTLDPAAAARPASPALARALGGVNRNVGHYARALDALQPEGRSATRGAAETRVYQAAAPAVVLVVTKDGLGSGVLVSADGRIVTNLHVVGDQTEVGVIFKPATEGAAVDKKDVRVAKVIRRDGLADLAVIQVAETPAGVTPLKIGASSAVKVGADVHAIGHPTGQSWTYTKGVVSQIRHGYAWSADDKVEHKATVIQTQTPINPGNSGGPLLDDNLLVVGINSFISDGEGINFAVSAEDVTALLALTADRAAPEIPKCEPVEISSGPMKKPKGVEYFMDGDCDGKIDSTVEVPDSKRYPIILFADSDGDGKYDTMLIDDGHDRDWDQALYDTDADGEPDLKGFYRDGEDEPYRMEKMAKK